MYLCKEDGTESIIKHTWSEVSVAINSEWILSVRGMFLAEKKIMKIPKKERNVYVRVLLIELRGPVHKVSVQIN